MDEFEPWTTSDAGSNCQATATVDEPIQIVC